MPPPGIEPGSMILQTIAMTTSAKAANILWGEGRGLNPHLSDSQSEPLPIELPSPLFGLRSRVRTCDPKSPRLVRYQAALYGGNLLVSLRGFEPRPPGPKPGTLPDYAIER